MFLTVGNSLITYIGMITTWLSTNFIGGMYMFLLAFVVFYIILSLGGKKKQ